MNSVRSPMAAALLREAARGDVLQVDSAGVYEGYLDPFVAAVMQEEAISMDNHEPKAMKTLDLAGFDVVVALTQEAAAEAKRLVDGERIELWDTVNPSGERGGRDAVLAAYRAVRDELRDRITDRFADFVQKS